MKRRTSLHLWLPQHRCIVLVVHSKIALFHILPLNLLLLLHTPPTVPTAQTSYSYFFFIIFSSCLTCPVPALGTLLTQHAPLKRQLLVAETAGVSPEEYKSTAHFLFVVHVRIKWLIQGVVCVLVFIQLTQNHNC